MELLEHSRNRLQITLDAGKTQAERNKLGQFATPTELAVEILSACKSLLPKREPIRFLDPAIGTGSFYSALLRVFGLGRIERAQGFEIDPHYGDEARRLWQGTPLQFNLADFTKAVAPKDDAKKANLIVCNPPYVRHHHLTGDEKIRLADAGEIIAGERLSGLAGLYCHFLLLSHSWMSKGGIGAWLIPSEFMDVNYGKAVKHYLLRSVTLLRVHRFDPNDLQFSDALVSSAVILFRNEPPPSRHSVEFSYGGGLEKPKMSKKFKATELQQISKWTGVLHREKSTKVGSGLKLSDLFKVKRGLATGNNKFFILTREQIREHEIPALFLTPILPSPRYLKQNVIEGSENGIPKIDDPLFLLGSNLDEQTVRRDFPSVWKYLERGRAEGVADTYLCNHRTVWYSQEDRPAPPILCTYMGRKDYGSLFRFILNKSKATATNVYLLLYPKAGLEELLKKKPSLIEPIWKALNDIPTDVLIGEGRVYGGGLHKLEPKELANAPADTILKAVPELASLGSSLFSNRLSQQVQV